MSFRTLIALSFALLCVAPAQAQEGGRAPANPAKPFTLKQVWTFDATYVDRQHGVTFRYPSVWKHATQFGYHPPALTQSDEAKPIAGFGYVEGGFPRSGVIGPYSATNLEGFGIVYSVVPAANASACETAASSLSEAPKHRAVVLGGRSFSEYDTGQAGMSQSNSGRLYASYIRPACYLFETDVAVLSGGFDGIQILTPAQSRIIDIHLLDIMKSVRIAPHAGQRN